MKKRLVLPGEMIGTSEEFLPGEGTFEENGKIFSKNVGTLEINEKERTVNVKTVNPPVVLKTGDIVVGTIRDVKSMMAIVDIEKAVGKNRRITGESTGAIHISKIASGYVKDVGSECRMNDIIRAKVIQTEPSLQLSMVGPEFGVLRAVCEKCRMPLEKDGNKLFCKHCERTETRKIANDYGTAEQKL
ncbi:MAG: exosome complex RNA-binding protein Csl4 [Thermoplasmatales archaeon]|nr:exosome complex RNA-binding protein Csl4 [Thermoplasmatales archaeon]